MSRINKRAIVEKFINAENMEAIIEFILEKQSFQNIDIDETAIEKLKGAVRTLKCRFQTKYQQSQRKIKQFNEKYAAWLDSEFIIPNLQPKTCNTISTKMGRPSLAFEKLSSRSQRREASAISVQNDCNVQKMLMASCHAAKKSGKHDIYVMLKNVLCNPEESKEKIKALQSKHEIIKKTTEEALAFLLDNRLSKQVYINMRLASKSSGADIWPAYNFLTEMKKQLRPPKEVVYISQNIAEVKLQPLLNHTASRIIKLQEEVLLQYLTTMNPIENTLKLVLICSWGFDGSSGYSAYKQRMENTAIEASDENLFATTLIPLRLSTEDNTIIFNNNISQSPRSNRPIRLQFVKESKEVIINEKRHIDDQIKDLHVLKYTLKNYQIQVKFSLVMTLIDGKVLNIITNTNSNQSCPICHANPKDFNNLSNIDSSKFSPNTESLQYGISPLHAWIRIFECCLHISYKLTIKKWQARGVEDRAECARKKKQIQEALWKELNLRVDQPKIGGSGTTNDGNTARRAFKDVNILSKYYMFRT